MRKKADQFRTMLQFVLIFLGLAIGSIALSGCVGGDGSDPFGTNDSDDDDDNNDDNNDDDNNDNNDDNNNDDNDNDDNDNDNNDNDEQSDDDDDTGGSDSDSDVDSDADSDADSDTDSDADSDSDSDSDSDTDTDTDTDADTDTSDPDAELCHPTAQNWPAAWAVWEEEVLALTNEARATPRSCGAEGSFGSAGPLTMNSKLRCAARVHAYDMSSNDYFSHDSPGGPIGDDMQERIETAGYTNWSTIGENIAQGQQSPAAVVEAWLGSDGHCANIMNSSFEEIGIGYADVSTPNEWVQDFGASF